MTTGGSVGFGAGESPPPSALAGRRKKDDIEAVRKNKKSMGLAIWSMWGSKHDEHTIEREQKAEHRDKHAPEETPAATEDPAAQVATATSVGTNGVRPSQSRQQSSNKALNNTGSRSRRRTITVTDTGQTEGNGQSTAGDEGPLTPTNGNIEAGNLIDNTLLTPVFLPRYKNLPTYLRNESKDASASAMTGNTTGDVDSLRNASTTAVFAAPGVLTDESRKHSTTQASMLSRSVTYDAEDGGNTPDLRSEVASIMRPETPASRRSIERLQSDQDPEHDNVMHLRNPSNVAIVGSEGIVGEVAGPTNADRAQRAETRVDDQGLEDKHQQVESQRPGMYDRKDTEFKTAIEF